MDALTALVNQCRVLLLLSELPFLDGTDSWPHGRPNSYLYASRDAGDGSLYLCLILQGCTYEWVPAYTGALERTAAIEAIIEHLQAQLKVGTLRRIIELLLKEAGHG